MKSGAAASRHTSITRPGEGRPEEPQALDAMSFDIRWQFALGLEPDDAILSRRALGEFRSRLVRVDPEMTRLLRLFERISGAAIDRHSGSESGAVAR